MTKDRYHSNVYFTSSAKATALLMLALLWGCSQQQSILVSDHYQKDYRMQYQEPHTYLRQTEAINLDAEQSLKAANSFIERGHYKQASLILKQLDITLFEDAVASEKDYLLGKIAYQKKRYRKAQKLLQDIDKDHLKDNEIIDFYQMQASIAASQNQHLKAAIIRSQLASYLKGGAWFQNNKDIFKSLSLVPKIKKLDYLDDYPQTSASAWIDMSLILDAITTGENKTYELGQWKGTYQASPLAQHVNTEAVINYVSGKKAYHIGLLLPFQGPMARHSKAIRDGVVKSYFDQKQRDYSIQIKVKSYDTKDYENLELALNEMLEDGITHIIGPVDKEQALAFSKLNIPEHLQVITLNSIDDSKPNVVSLNASSAVDTINIVHHARLHHKRKALLLSASSNWARNNARSFIANWQATGGELVGSYFLKESGFKSTIRDIMGVGSSYSRTRALKRTLHTDVKFVPHHRDDIDVVFVSGTARFIKELKPMLNFYYAGDIPVYTLSNVHDGTKSSMAQKDLRNIIFPEMPYLHQNTELSDYKNQSYQLSRLYALGYDALRLALYKPVLLAIPDYGLAGLSGFIQLDQQQGIVRVPNFVQFQRGRLRHLAS